MRIRILSTLDPGFGMEKIGIYSNTARNVIRIWLWACVSWGFGTFNLDVPGIQDISFSLCSLVFRYRPQQQPGRPARPRQLQPRLQHAATAAAAPAAAAATAGSAHHVPAAAGQQSFPGDVDGRSAAAAGAKDDRLATTECVPGAFQPVLWIRIRNYVITGPDPFSLSKNHSNFRKKILCFIIFRYQWFNICLITFIFNGNWSVREWSGSGRIRN